MKKVFALLAVAGMLTFGASNSVFAQEESTEVTTEVTTEEANGEMTEETASEEGAAMEAGEEAPAEEMMAEEAAPAEEMMAEEVAPAQLDQEHVLLKKFIEGGPFFMAIVLLALVIGLALCIERIIYLNMSTTNTKKLLLNIEEALKNDGIEAAKEVCRNTSGPVASIFYQGLDRHFEGVDKVEKAVIAYGGVQMGLLEKGLSWIQLFIALAPMLGFMGTVIGMIGAFDDIQAQKTIKPEVVAGGIKVALLTTVFGLVVAIILQIFYNYILSKIDSLVNQMEDASISLIDILIKNELSK